MDLGSYVVQWIQWNCGNKQFYDQRIAVLGDWEVSCIDTDYILEFNRVMQKIDELCVEGDR